MRSIRKLYEAMRDKVFGVASEEAAPAVLPKRPISRLNQGPATAKYVKSLFPRGIFTKTLTHCRVEQIREVMRSMRPDQKKIARAKGWTRGLDL